MKSHRSYGNGIRPPNNKSHFFIITQLNQILLLILLIEIPNKTPFSFPHFFGLILTKSQLKFSTKPSYMIQVQPPFKFSTTALLLFLLFLTLFPTSKASPTYTSSLCPNITTYTPNSIYQSNLLSSPSAVDEFSNSTAGNNPPDASYGLFLCRGDLSSTSCHHCVSTATTQVLQLCPISKWAAIWYDECMLRYSDTSIFAAAPSPLLSTPPQPLSSGKGGILWRVLVGVIVPIGVIGFCFPCSKTKKKYYISKPHASRDELTTLQSLQYDLSTVRAATNNFSDDNKIGMGGFGPVYKGTLPNGEEVAVKRLSKNSRQGVEQFKNEVVLIAKIQHVNLVRLLGFCLEGEEKILIYEFLPNKSLDKFLFDSQEQEKLDWPQRYKIIQGIAHGMLYLHEYSSLRIIHRDLKAGNILLDGNMNAKISDFGMARIFNVDQTRAITSRVVGTYGYISPEYAMHGQFSVKSDVFSFGVLLLEVISGKKTNSFYKPDCVENLLTYAWKLWNDGTPLELMDQALEGSYSRNDVHRCIHIGLLCVQHNPDARPSMAKVVRMLNRYSSMSLPQQPAFFAQSRTTSRTLQGLELDRPIDRPIPLPVNEDSVAELYHR